MLNFDFYGLFDYDEAGGDTYQYTSEEFSSLIQGITGNGISANYLNQFQPTANGLDITIKSGAAFVNGRWGYNSAAKTISLSPTTSTTKKIDRIVIELDVASRVIGLNTLTGTATTGTPTAPALSDNQLAICSVLVANGSTTTLTDERVFTYSAAEVQNQINALKANASNHTHGNITHDGKISGQANKGLIVNASGSIVAADAATVRSTIGAAASFNVLPVAEGGTGANTAATARTNLGITPANIGAEAAFDVLPLTKGGLGTTSRTTARENLQVLTYKGYDNGYFETGAGNTSAWLQYRVSGETKCQMDLFSDGKVGIGGKTVLVAGDVIGYTKYNTNKLAMDSWLDNNAYTLALRDDGTDKCVLAMWNGGALSVNGSIVATEGRDNTFSGTLTVSNNNSAGGYVKIWEDNEGGNIEIGSKSGYNYQMDAYNDILRLYSQKSGGVVQLAACDGSTGAWDFPFLTVNKLELDGKESQTLQMRNATSDTSEVSITFYQGSTQRWTLGAGCGSAGNDFTLWDHTNSTLALDMRSNKYLYVYGNWVYDQRSVVYSSTAPTDVYTGKIWLKPV